MHKYKIQITESAEQDFEDISNYIAYDLKSQSAAFNIVNGIRKKILLLANRHELDEDPFLAKLGVRRHYYKNYKIYYMVYEQGHCVIILRILHMLVDSRAKIYRIFNQLANHE